MSLINRSALIDRLIDCSGCTCCYAGSVYVFPEEVPKLNLYGVKVIEAFGIYLLPLDQKGCIYNDPISHKCKIYRHRPICCRLFPFDIYLNMYTQNLYWIYYRKCKKIIEKLKKASV